VVLTICHQNVSLVVHSDSFQTLEFSIILSPSSKGSKESTVRVEYLDSIISGIGDKDKSTLIHSDTPVGGYIGVKKKNKRKLRILNG